MAFRPTGDLEPRRENHTKTNKKKDSILDRNMSYSRINKRVLFSLAISESTAIIMNRPLEQEMRALLRKRQRLMEKEEKKEKKRS